MPKLYIANTTKQRFSFEFRRPETGRMLLRNIEPGAQLMVLDTDSFEIDAIINHFGRYGMIDARNVDHSQAFIGLCYAIDKPVKHSVLVKALKDNDNHLDRAGHERRKVQVAATENKLRQQQTETGSGYRGDLEFEVTEQRGPDANKELLEETLATETNQKKPNARKNRK